MSRVSFLFAAALGVFAWLSPEYGWPVLAGFALFYLITIAGVLKDIRDKRGE